MKVKQAADEREKRDAEIERLRADLAAANKRAANRLVVEAERDALRELLREASVYLDDVDGTGPLDLQCRIDAALKGENE